MIPGLRYRRRVDRTCAVCDGPVTLVQRGLSRRKGNVPGTPYAAVAWCRLHPCGHMFAVRRGALIH